MGAKRRGDFYRVSSKSVLIDTTSTIYTPERVRFRYRLAGPGRRSVAWGIDAALQGGVLFVVGVTSLLVGGEGWGTGALLLFLFLLTWFYGALFETLLRGRTPGKIMLGLRVVSFSGAPARPVQVVLRNLLRGADFLPFGYGVGVLVMGADSRLRRIGDLVAGTVVVDESAGTLQADIELRSPVTEEERRGLPARVELNRGERAAIEAFLRRRSKLSDGRAEELAALFSPILRDLGVDADSEERVLTLAYARSTGIDRALEEE